MPTNPFRLPRHAVPTRYELVLQPDLEAAVFSGTASIDLSVTEPTSELVLNAAELSISTASLTTADGDEVPATVTLDEKLERAHVTLSRQIEAGDHRLTMSFDGVLNDQLRGFYRSTYTDVTGVEQVIATTQFEAADARRAFPCWDEPDFKATFAITLVVPDHLLAVSNAQEVSRSPAGPGRVAVSFAETMKMSTYIVAFVVGPFEATDPVDVGGVPLRIVAPVGKGHLTDFALEASAACLRYLSDYYGIPYPGDKVDMIAIPDFAFGAMENLGAITYRETALLIDPATTGLTEQRRILDVIAHELAHMWFGDLVTMGWWEGIWLNEAFASFMEMKTTSSLRPEWNRWLSFAVDPGAERSGAMIVDALATTRPVEFKVESPEEADEMFDALTYGKGSALLRMIEQYLGVEVFRKGVATYLERHSYANTVTSDLWAGLDSASGEPVGPIMDTWILQGGYPQVSVNVEPDGVRLRQRRFTLLENDDPTLWQIPIQLTVKTESGIETHKVLMTAPETLVDLEAPVEWVNANAGGHGFYRVAYTPIMLERLTAALSDMDDLERFTLLDDTYAFVLSGQLDAASFLHLAEAYRDEEESAIWQMLIGHLAHLEHVLPEEASDLFAARARRLIGRRAEILGWEPAPGESDLTRQLRGQMIRAMGILGKDPETIATARRKADEMMADPRSLDPDVGQAALFVSASHGDAALYDSYLEGYQTADTPHQKLRYLQALCDFPKLELATATFDRALGGEIKTQDGAWVIARMMMHRSVGADVWRLVQERWEEIVAVLPPVTLRNILSGLSSLSTPELAAEVEAFFADREVPSGAKTLAQKLEQLRANVALGQREAERLVAELS